jgi:hypothetical protein
MTIATVALKPVRTAMSGPAMTQIAAGRTAFGAYVARVASGTAMGAPLEDTEDGLGFACGDNLEHTYDGFYETYEPMPIITSGIVNGLVTAIDAYSLVAGDYLEVADFSSGTNALPVGVLAEAGTHAGEAKTTTSVAQILEDLTLAAAVYAHPASQVEIGVSTITMAANAYATMGLNIGDFIVLADADGNAHLNRVTNLTSTVISLLQPSLVVVATGDYVYAVRQAKMRIL